MVFRKFLVEKVRHELLEVFSCRCSRRKSVINGVSLYSDFTMEKFYYPGKNTL